MICTMLYSTVQNKKKEIITGEIEKEIHTTFCIRERELHTLLIFKGSSATQYPMRVCYNFFNQINLY